MKIAYFINQYPKVSHSFIRREILALERQGHEVLRIALRGWDGPLPDEEDQVERKRTRYVLRHGAIALLIPLLRVALRSPMKFASALQLAVRMSRVSDRPLPYHLIYLAEACRILGWLANAKSCHVHAHFGTNSTEVVMLAHALGGPTYSMTVHGADEYMKPMGLQEKIHRATFVVAISSFGRSQLYMRAQYSDWPKIKIVHCGIESTLYEAPRTPVPSAPRLVCVGRLCEMKGQLLLLEAAKRLAGKGIEFELVLAGDGELRSQIEAHIAKCGLQDRVRITGWLTSAQVIDEVQRSRALVLPSFAEGLPVVVMEAMALRRPVLTTYVGGIPELVRHGENGWLFPAGSIEQLSDAMEDCLTRSSEQLDALGEAGHQRVIARHCIDVEAAKLGTLFNACSAAPRYRIECGSTQAEGGL